MSWDATLRTTFGTCVGDWNYTHNTNPMIAEALHDIGYFGARDVGPDLFAQAIGPRWWEKLDDMTGAEGAKFLTKLIEQLESDPDKYRTFDPPNEWGSYDTLLVVLRQMRDATMTEEPLHWTVTG